VCIKKFGIEAPDTRTNGIQADKKAKKRIKTP
jgi:hypothetical protein